MIIRLIRLLFFPLSILYGVIINLRNYQFNSGLKSMISMEPTIISVGNLTTGGTGKTPMVEYLVRLLKNKQDTAVLSRGYGRKTRGFRLANAMDTAETIGDEPLQYTRKFGNEVHVAVSEERVLGVSSLLLDHPGTQLFLLDDAFQHRFIARDLNILLTSFHKPFFKDWLLPAGDLREPRREADRADIVVVTKCPEQLTSDLKQQYEQRIRTYNQQAAVFFSSIHYAQPEMAIGKHPLDNRAILLTGIANPKPLIEYVERDFEVISHMNYPDHYQFRKRDLERIKQAAVENNVTTLLTTEKDMVRLLSFKDHSLFRYCTLFCLPIEVRIENAQAFDELVYKSLKG